MVTAAAVWVDVLPSMKNFTRDMVRGLNGTGNAAAAAINGEMDRGVTQNAEKTGRSAGSRLAAGFGSTARTALRAPVNAMSSAFDGIARYAESAGARAGTGFGSRVSMGLGGAAQAITNFRHGLMGADAQMGALGNRAAATGGSLRSALASGAMPLGTLRAGLAGADAQMGGLGSRAYTLGSTLRGAIDAGIRPLNNLHNGFVSSAAAASAFTGRAGTMGGVVRGALEGAAGATFGLRQGLAGNTVTMDTLAGRASPFGGAMRSGFASAAIGAAGMGGAIRNASSSFDQMSSRMATGANGLMAPLRNSAGAFGGFGVAASLAGTLGVGALAGMGIGFNRFKQDSQVAFGTMLGSAEKAQSFLDDMMAFAKTTPFAYPDLVQGAQRMIAFGFSAEQVIPALKDIGDTTAGLGGGAEVFNRITTAIGQMQARGKVSAEELMQLAEVGVPALRILANQYGVSTEEMQKMIQTGQVMADDALPKLFEGMREGTDGLAGQTARMGGLMEELGGTTLTGALDKMKGAIRRTMGQLFEPVMPALQRGVEMAAAAISKLPEMMTSFGNAALPFINAIRPAFQQIGEFLGQHLFPAIGNLLQALTPLWQAIGGALVVAFRALGWVLTTLVGPAISAVTGFLKENQWITAIIVGALGAYVTWLTLAKGVMMAYQAAVRIVTIATAAWNAVMSMNPITLIILAIGALVGAFIWLWNNVEGFRNFWVTVWDGIKLAAVWAWQNFLYPIFNALVTGLSWIGNALVWLWQNVFVPGWNAISAAVSWAWNSIIMPIFNALAIGFQWLGAVLMAVLVTPFVIGWNLLGTVVSFVWNSIILPIWNTMAAVALWLWHSVLYPVWEWMKGGWNSLGMAWQWVYDSLISPMFSALMNLVLWVWNAVLYPVWEWMKAGWNALGAAWRWVYDVIIWPMFTALMNLVLWVWNAVLYPVWEWMKMGWNALGAAWRWVYDVLIWPMFTALMNLVLWVWHAVLYPVWEWMKAGWNALATFWRWVYDVIIWPMFSALMNLVLWVWHAVLSPVFEWIKAGFHAVGNFFQWVYDTILKPVWDALGATIMWVWENVIRVAFDAIKAGLDTVRTAFESAVGFIQDMWDRLKGIVAAPINFVIDKVYNGGIVAVWNKIAGWLGLPELEKASLISFSGGGIVPGYAPGRDTVPAMLSPGESVLTPEATRAIGPSNILAFNKKMSGRSGTNPGGVSGRGSGMSAILGGMGVPQQEFAGGGVAGLFNIVKSQFPQARLNSGFRPGDPGYHGRGQAIDIGLQGVPGGLGNSFMAAVKTWLFHNFPHSTELIYNGLGNAVPNLKNGKPFPYSIATQLAHRNHVHWAMAGNPGDPLGVDGGGGFFDVAGMFGWINELIDGMLGQFGDNPFVKGIIKFPQKIIQSLIDKAMEMISKMFTTEVSGNGSSGMAGVDRWVPLMQQALDRTGQNTPMNMLAFRKRMQQESGGNPFAINNWDSNAKRGTPSKGLMQVIQPTFDRYRDPSLPNNILDPLANMVAAIRYTLARYGSLQAGWNRPGGYDSGGWLMPGWTPVYNGTGKPEAVFTSEQWDTIQRNGLPGSGSGPEYHIHAEQRSAESIAREIDRVTAMRRRR